MSTAPKLDETADDVEHHDMLFSKPLRFFESSPYSDNFTDVREDQLFCLPQEPYSSVYQFTRPGNSVGLLKTSDAKISATVSICNAAGVLSTANANVAIPPVLLRTLWKTKELKINESLVTPADNHGSYVSYLNFLLHNTPTTYKDSKAVNGAYLDTAGQMDIITAGNAGMRFRRDFITNARKVIVDDVDIACFSECGGEVYIPSAFKLDIRFVRESLTRVLMGGDHADLHIDQAKLKIEDLKIKFPIFKPNAQLTAALNIGFVNKHEEAKWYASSYRCVTTSLAAGRETHQENDIFNGSVPVRLFIFFVPQANYNGSFATNMFNFTWEHYKFIDVTVNNASVGRIENSQEAYNRLRDVLNRKYTEMPLTYNQYINGYGIVAFDLTATRDTHLTTLPVVTTGCASAHIDFTQGIQEGTLFFVGEFRNEIKAGVTTPARLLYNY